MSGTPKPPSSTVATVGGILQVLAGANGYVTLAIQVAGVLVPLGKALIQKIEGIGTAAVTVTFGDLVASDLTELDAITTLASSDLAAINAELARLGLPQLPTT